MVAFVQDPRAAAKLFDLACGRSFPDPYSMYMVEVFLQLLDATEVSEFQQFFKLCGIDAHVIQLPAPKKEKAA